jgi:hypothetical protein
MIYKTLHRKLNIEQADNTMVEWKRTKRQLMIYKTLHRKLKIEQTDNTMVKEKEQKTINDLQNTTQKTKD